MKLIIAGGPPSTGKTSVLLHTLEKLKDKGKKIHVVKLDCLVGGDEERYKKNGFEAVTGLSVYVCPDHYLATNIDRIIEWGFKNNCDYLIIESAGLCNRCSPHLKDVLSVVILDMLSSNAPKKIGPLLKSADIAVLTKGDLISQAEREVFCIHLSRVAPKVKILEVNGLTGQRTNILSNWFEKAEDIDNAGGHLSLKRRYPMPGAVCSFCLGEKRVGQHFAKGSYRLIQFPDYQIGDMRL